MQVDFRRDNLFTVQTGRANVLVAAARRMPRCNGSRPGNADVMLRTLLALLILALPAGAETISGPASVIDGDTIDIHGARRGARKYGVGLLDLAYPPLQGHEGNLWSSQRKSALRPKSRRGGSAVGPREYGPPTLRSLKVRFLFLLTNAADLEVFSWCPCETYVFQRLVKNSPNPRSHQVRRISALRDRFRAV